MQLVLEIPSFAESWYAFFLNHIRPGKLKATTTARGCCNLADESSLPHTTGLNTVGVKRKQKEKREREDRSEEEHMA